MKLALIGSEGSIGKRRSMILQELGHKVTGYDAKKHTFFSEKEATQYDAVFVCLPPNQCVVNATDCVKANVPFFLEKPGAANYREFLSLSSKVEKTNLVNMVACNLRFTAEYRAIQDALPNIGKPLFAYAEFGYFLPFWREGQYRTYYSCFRAAGGGILMDSVHELDYTFNLFGYPEKPKLCVVTHENTKELPDLDAEDSANVFIVYKNGMALTIHMDYLQRCYKRVFHCVGTKGRIDQTFNVQGSNEMYRREMTDFLRCVKTGEETVKPVTQHVKLLEFIDKAVNTKGEITDD